MDSQAVIAAIRFGMGRRPSDPVPPDPAAWLDSQLDPALPGPPVPDGVPPTMKAILAELREDNVTARSAMGRPNSLRIQRAEVRANLAYVMDSPNGFRERLVAFWTNHFTTARQKVPYFVGHMVREAIRPHVCGPFADMLVAVTRHPAMLAYLDNAASIGPNSQAGRRRSLGLNENLAREILELHTLSPAAGYSQADVTAFAKVLTGWAYGPNGDDAEAFEFRPYAHEPGPKTVMGRTFPPGYEGGLQALAWLGRHPATYHHLSVKLARHFVADDPPPAAVQRIEAALRESGGNLGAASRALVRMPEAWSTPLAKLRNPTDYVIAVLRAVEAPSDAAQQAEGALRFLGQTVWGPPAPIGWPDLASDWAAPEALLRRIGWANGVSRLGSGRDASAVAETVLGPLCRRETLQAAARAGSAREALTLVLTSPEFQRR